MQSTDHRQWQKEYGEVSDDVSAGVDVPLWRKWNAGTFNGFIPEPRYRPAVEYNDKNLRDAPAADDSK
jgi:hypothetical protein